MSIKVLIVEDNEDYSQLLKYFLVGKGFEVVTAGNGNEAVELALKESPNIILMDLNLPVLDGWEATRMISQNESTKHVPILAVSANCQLRGEEVLEAGAVGCVQKPIDIAQLPDLILSYANNDA